jgi:cytosine/adenosine deaminase-related metal-dependent hydrolase
MTDSYQIFCKFALIGSKLSLVENVRIKIDQGKISTIESNINQEKLNKKNIKTFSHHLLVPKFINSHIHLSDASLKDQVYNLSLNESVGTEGYKYRIYSLPRSTRISAMREALKEAIEYGTSACYDFKEGGLKGIQELNEAKAGLPIEIRILGRPGEKTELDTVITHSDGLGLSSPVLYSIEELTAIRNRISSKKALVATHIGEDPQVIREAIVKYGYSDLQLALKYLDPNMLVHLTCSSESDLNQIPISKFLVFCPRSNAYFGLGVPPVNYFLNKGYLIGLGTDNVMTTPPNILNELRWLVLRLKERCISINPIQALQLITTNPSKALNLSTGCIEVGYWADILVINLQSYRTAFGNDPISSLLFRAHLPNDVSLNMFHGEIVSGEYR